MFFLIAYIAMQQNESEIISVPVLSFAKSLMIISRVHVGLSVERALYL
jgi:hypothetical protein